MLCTAWDDGSPHMETFWRGFIASAEYSWSPDGRTLEEFDIAWLQREFGISMQNYANFNRQLSDGLEFWKKAYYRNGSRSGDDNALQSLVRLEHWLTPVEGMEKRCFDYTTKLIELPDLNSPGTWSLKYKERLDKASLEADIYNSLSGRLNELYNESKRNSYYWELSAVLYGLYSSAPRILMALKQCDTNNKSQLKDGIESLKNAMNQFHKSWSEVKSVYSQTRFISYPANYVPDRYFHAASQREDLSWMVQCEEMYFGMINKWLQSQQLN
jgi:hexosaminidase